MASSRFAFVDAVSDSPTVLLELHDFAPFHVVTWSAPPPSISRSLTRSNTRDDSNVTQSSYDEREITIQLAINSTSSDNAAEAIQALGRLLNSDGQWLRVSLNTIEPVFFRTKRAEITQIEEFNGVPEDGFRIATVVIPAEPFAYGLPVTGTATIANDPTVAASSNPMSYVFPDVQGDVATPLSLTLNPAGAGPRNFLLGSSAGGSSPVVPQRAQPAKGGAISGWTQTNAFADTDAISGTTLRNVNSGTTATCTSSAIQTGIAPGDYRILFRAWSSVAGSSIIVNSAITVSLVSGSNYRWYDAGVFRLPGGSPIVAAAPGLAVVGVSSAGARLDFKTTGAGEIRADEVLFIPAGLDDAQASRMMIVRSNLVSVGGAVQVDSPTDSVWLGGTNIFAGYMSFSGALPVVVPGVANLISLVLDTSQTTIDDKTATTPVTYLYYPRYLYIRPASS